jgi:hypothetical protein
MRAADAVQLGRTVRIDLKPPARTRRLAAGFVTRERRRCIGNGSAATPFAFRSSSDLFERIFTFDFPSHPESLHRGCAGGSKSVNSWQ